VKQVLLLFDVDVVECAPGLIHGKEYGFQERGRAGILTAKMAVVALPWALLPLYPRIGLFM